MANATQSLVMPDGSSYEFFGKSYYGVSDGGVYSSSYRVDIDGFTQESLVAGVRVSVCFENANQYPNIASYLNVSNTGMKSIRFASGTYLPNGGGLWCAGQVVDFVYNGTDWVIHPSASRVILCECTTDASTAAKTVSGTQANGFAHVHRAMVLVGFTYGNTATNPTLNIDSTGAHAITNGMDSNGNDIYVGKFRGGYHLLVLVNTGTKTVWRDLTYTPISDSTSLNSSTTYASSAAVRSAYNVANSKYTKPSTGIPASDLADGVIPTAVSELDNDSGYLTLADLPIYDGSVS